MKTYSIILYPLLTSLLLAGCQTLPSTASNEDASSRSESVDTVVDTIADTINDTIDDSTPPPIQYRSFPTDTLYSLLVAEVAASRQDFKTTSDNYLAQAKETNDINVIARAARISQFFRDHPNSIAMGQLWVDQKPNNIEALTLMANAYLESGQPLIAVDITEEILLALKNDAKSSTQSAMPDGGSLLEVIANQNQQASSLTLNGLMDRFEQLSTDYPELAGIKVGLSVLTQGNGDIKAANHWISQALEQDPERTSAIVQEVLLLQQAKQYKEAIAKLETQLAKNPTNNRLRLVYARVLTNDNQLEKAYEQFALLSEKSPQQLDLQFSLAIIALEINKLDEAHTLFTQLQAINYRSDFTGIYLGNIEEKKGNTNNAITAYLSVTEGDNYLPASYRAARLLLQQNQLVKAQALYSELRKQQPQKTEELYVSESSLLMQEKSNDAALILLNKAITQFPDNNDLRYNRATIYERLDNIDLMEADFRYVLVKEPDNVDALNGLGYFLTIRTTRFQEAKALIDRAIALKEDNPAIMDSLGWVLFKLGDIENSIQWLRKAYAIFPDAEIAAHLGEALWANEQLEEARKIWQESLEKQPDAPDVVETLERLDVKL